MTTPRTTKQRLESLVDELTASGILFEEAVLVFQKLFIIRVLQQNKGNQCKAARELRMHRNTMSRWLRTLKIDSKEFHQPGWIHPPKPRFQQDRRFNNNMYSGA